MEEQFYERAKAFIKLVASIGAINPLAEHEIILNGNCALTLCIDKFNANSVRLSEIRTFEGGKGHGRAALKQLCDLADKEGIRIVGTVKPTIKKRLNKRQLCSWYKRNRFQEGCCKDQIVRIPI